MRVLFLTWEFPPFISGGMGMACYGLVKSLLDKGVEVDMLLPTTEDVVFTLRRPNDVDDLPFTFLDPKKRTSSQADLIYRSHIRERLRMLGLSESPETYLAEGIEYEKVMEFMEKLYHSGFYPGAEEVRIHLSGEENLFKKVKEYTVRALKYFSWLDCDVIHANDWLTYPAAIALRNLLGKKLATHIHATEFDRAGGPGDERIHKIEYAGLTSADLVITVSQYTMQMLVDRYAVTPRKVRVVHNAYSLSSMMPQRQRLFKEPVVLFLGRVTIQKGPDYFLEVAHRVVERHPKVRFIMAGSGDMFTRIIRGSAAKRLKDRMLFTGFLDREKVEKILAVTDIYVLTSVSEPFGIAPLEAMANGAVAIVSKQSGVSEVVQNAYKVDFWDVEKATDIIVNLLENPEKREQLAKAGQEEAMAIGWHCAAEKVMDIYRELSC